MKSDLGLRLNGSAAILHINTEARIPCILNVNKRPLSNAESVWITLSSLYLYRFDNSMFLTQYVATGITTIKSYTPDTKKLETRAFCHNS